MGILPLIGCPTHARSRRKFRAVLRHLGNVRRNNVPANAHKNYPTGSRCITGLVEVDTVEIDRVEIDRVEIDRVEMNGVRLARRLV
jgi:hypothetical protein